ncbi:RluA family pseudouridine synthase [Mesonia maritima]|uniref:tRNA pseudouridine65 synthase/23S rRNA pseudouridine1911/1915/1917 synthase n=1 Tax=Mesonia maritima TaxID=1793873 RepID=A0ABU1K3B6_9FLAO|nr:RluA family pseudouridine synthase [Mesonia maritima]MDR6300106.1 tRNA pseudouridine65 synthase/23S rRNA pseudouridine1911/1915/1917 synthase [Mesonia maritima]
MKIIEKHIVPKIEEAIRMQEYAPRVFKTLATRSAVKKNIKKNLILLDGKPANTGDWIKKGQVLQLLQEEKAKKVFRLKLKVIFEDEYLAVIHKPAGYPTSGNYFKTIENALSFNLKTSTTPDALLLPLPVHRLDNPTSGLLIIAKTKQAQIKLNATFENKEIEKSYLAIVSGDLPEKGKIKDEIEGKNAETVFKKLQKFYKTEQEFSLVELYPKTGRTHQLRIHLSNLAHPIVGDEQYGSKVKAQGIYLTAFSLQFNHPILQEKLNFKSDLPKKFEKFLK